MSITVKCQGAGITKDLHPMSIVHASLALAAVCCDVLDSWKGLRNKSLSNNSLSNKSLSNKSRNFRKSCKQIQRLRA